MVEKSRPILQVQTLPASQGLNWFVCGWRIVQARPQLWLGVAAFYLVLAAILNRIPFMGPLVLVLLTPLLLAGVLRSLQARELGVEFMPMRTALSPWHGVLDTYVVPPWRVLMRTFTEPTHLYAAVLVAIITLGLFMVVKIFEYLIAGDSMGSALAAVNTGSAAPVAMLFKLLLVALLHVLLLMGLFYYVHLAVLGDQEPLAALAQGFAACWRNTLALSLFTAVFLIPYVLIESAFAIAAWLGYLLLFTVGVVALASFITGTYCSYREVFTLVPQVLRTPE